MNTHRPDDDRSDNERLPGEDELGALYRKLPRKEPGPASAGFAMPGLRCRAATLIHGRLYP